ncbi:hypothetical protein EK904_004621 [Melospiza melodia maxima]|nr:hypothetical protein EK904_004621 [Melospiza melodia maxima]
MDSFVCSPISPYPNLRSRPALGRGWDTAAKQPSWKQSKSGSISPFLGGPFSPLPSDYLDSYRRAQLQALLSQVGPALAPRPRWASTKEAAVQVYFKQLCRKCQKGFNPYRVETIQCQICSKTRCSCPQRKRHIDLKRPHRQELCGRCKDKRLSCDSTYSFKYVV